MSGIITGPYFKQFFNNPGPIEVGTMVAVLELGALGMFLMTGFALYNDIHSHVDCCWSRRRHHWPEGDPLHWSYRFHHWWCYSDIYHRLLRHDRWSSGKRLWSWALVVGPQG